MQESRTSWVAGGIEEAGEGTRTPNLLITNQLLYQLSYASDVPESLMPGDATHILSDRKANPTPTSATTTRSHADRPSCGVASAGSPDASSGVRTNPAGVRS